MNALDNKEARNHVNRMCLICDVPLIESGTAGYNGQVELIKSGVSQCYECLPKAAQKTYPGCTIRNTPTEPIHCIVWAKHLYNQLFGEYNADEDVSPDSADPDADPEATDENLEKNKGNIQRISTRQWAKSVNYDPEQLFNKFFCDDITYLLSMSNLWKTRTPPTPAKFKEGVTTLEITEMKELHDQTVWSMIDYTKMFEKSVNNIREQYSDLADGDNLVWDKDDSDAMDFVAAAANIRANIFTIPLKSRFDIKSMAGNIIPAIATTNAITAGFVVMHAFKALQKKYENCQTVYVRLRPNARNQIFCPDRFINPPNVNCAVCSKCQPDVFLYIDTTNVLVKDFVQNVLIDGLKVDEPEVTLSGTGSIIVSSEEGETECNNDKRLNTLAVVDGCVLKIEDYSLDFEFKILVFHHDEPEFKLDYDIERYDKLRLKLNKSETEKDSVESTNGNGTSSSAAGSSSPVAGCSKDDDEVLIGIDVAPGDEDDDLCIVEEDESKPVPAPEIRKRDLEEAGSSGTQSAAKRQKTELEPELMDTTDDDTIVIN